MAPGFFLFNFWAKKYEVIFFNCGENFGLSIVQKIKRTMSGLVASFVYPSMSLHHFKRVQMFIKSLRCGSKGGWDGCLLVWLTTLPPTFWEDVVVLLTKNIMCMLLWEKKIGLVYLLSVLINGKLLKKFMQKWLPKKHFSLNVRKC